MIYGGDGLARLPADEKGVGKAVFVPFVLPGEKVAAEMIEQKPGFARARAEVILKPSPLRIEPGCPYFLRCGGCHYQHAGYEEQLAIKSEILRENLRRIGKVELTGELTVHASPPWSYRNRTRLRVRGAPNFAIGYHKFGSHELLPAEECPISSPLLNRAITAMWELGRAGHVPEHAREIEFFANSEDDGFLVEVLCDATEQVNALERWSQEFQAVMPEMVGALWQRSAEASMTATGSSGRKIHIAQRSKNDGGFELLTGAQELAYRTGDATYRVSAGSFFQVNRHMTGELIKIVCEGQSGWEALDLYAGVGLFSLPLARQFDHILAVESSQSSFADLRYNSPANVKAVRSTVEQYLAKPGKSRPDLVVVDPPRGGLGEKVAQKIATMRASGISYVSCDPATLARDLKVLLASGYRIQQAHLVDLFPQTFHLESVLQLAL